MPITQEEVQKLHNMQSRILAGEQIPAEELHEAIRISRQWRSSNAEARAQAPKGKKREGKEPKGPPMTMEALRALVLKKNTSEASEGPKE